MPSSFFYDLSCDGSPEFLTRDESFDVKDLVWDRVLRVVFGISFDLEDIEDLATGGGMFSYDMVSSGKVSNNRGLLGGGNILLSSNMLLVSDSDDRGGRNTSSDEIVLSFAKL